MEIQPTTINIQQLVVQSDNLLKVQKIGTITMMKWGHKVIPILLAGSKLMHKHSEIVEKH